MGGIGKTTLAQLAYNHEKVTTYFHERMWVCVSDPFDPMRISRDILEALQKDSCGFHNLEAVQQKIRTLIADKKFLLVLDDVWTENYELWEQVESSLKGGAPGSRILVTTRNENVSTMMGTTYKHPLGELSKEQCWSLFSNIAFYGRSREKVEELENIGRKIADKCRGLPLAAKVLGSLMRLKDNKEDWESILNNEIWQLDVIEKHLSTPLLLNLSGNIFPGELPRNLGKLIHLRFLNLSFNERLKELPETICDLYNLQTLEVIYCEGLRKLPQGMRKLINLRHLELNGSGVSDLPKGIGRLTSLRTLTRFPIGDHFRRDVCKIGELKNLNSLRGGLVISGIANVKDAEEAGEAELKNKKHLHHLELEDFGKGGAEECG
ncbi:unnamed protein product, partial [Vitis vinifera]